MWTDPLAAIISMPVQSARARGLVGPGETGSCTSGTFQTVGNEAQIQDFVLGLAPVADTAVWSLGYGVVGSAGASVVKRPYPSAPAGLPDPNSVPGAPRSARKGGAPSLKTGAPQTAGRPVPIPQYWNGKAFAYDAVPTLPGVEQYSQASVAVPDPHTGLPSGVVWAVGTVYHTSIPPGAFAVRWDPSGGAGGVWSNIPLPVVAGSSSTALRAVSATSATDVWAVGSYYLDGYGGGYRNLAIHFDGTVWSIVPTPSPSSFQTIFSVSAVSPTDVWGVGTIAGANGGQTMVLHWDGSSWSIVLSPAPEAASWLNGVTAVSSDDVWAVGREFLRSNPFETRTLTLHWNGSVWSIVPSANAGGPSNSNGLQAVTYTSPNDVWAAGDWWSDNAHSSTLVLHYTDGQWTIVTTPSPGNGQNSLYAISAVPRSLATWLKKQGIDDALIQPYSGHASSESLEIYSRMAMSDAQEGYNEVISRFPV